MLNSSVFIILFFSLIEISTQCHCPATFTQLKVCDSDVVLEVTVHSVERRGLYDAYTVSIGQVFKGNEILRRLTDSRTIKTPIDSAMCGPVGLELHQTYTLTGNVYDDGMMYVTFCDYVEEVTTMSEAVVRGLEGQYLSSCHCKIPYMWGRIRRGRRHCGEAPRECSWDAVCTSDTRGRCKWLCG